MPRLIASILLLVSLTMTVPLGGVLLRLGRGAPVPLSLWAFPVAILGTGAILMWMLTKKEIPLRLYVVALALWLVAAAYLLASVELVPRR